jgi:hypothetical protein
MIISTFNTQHSTLNVQGQRPKVGCDRPGLRSFCEGDGARRGHRNGFYTKIAKSRWCFCYQKQKQSLLGNWLKADLSRFVSFATFPVLRSLDEEGCENGLGNRGAPGGRALPRKAESKRP